MESEAKVEPEILLLSLPDDALLAVLAFLSPRELFACRVACRRLRDLCLHHHLWRAASVESKGVLRAALALAPCIGTIARVPIEALEPLVSATACTVSGLWLRVYGEHSIALALALLSRFSAVSSGLRLTKLTLELRVHDEAASPIFQAVYALNGLQDLSFNQDLDSASWDELEVLPSSLKKIRSTSRSTGAFLKLLLRTHSATLEDVDIGYVGTDVPWLSLASLPRLRSLTCNQGEGLSHLASLPIVHLDIFIIEKDDAYAPGALEFLSKASHLRTVMLSASRHVIDAPLLALENSPSAPTLESLDVNGYYDYRGADVPSMVAPILPKFPSLKSLILSIENEPLPEDLLQAVSPSSAPCLTMLELHVTDTPDFGFDGSESETPFCLHEAVHGPFVLDLLVRNPLLHLRVVNCYREYCKCCPWCRWGCHARLGRSTEVSLSSHSLRAGCPLDCYQVVRSGGRPHAAGEENSVPN